MTFSKKIKAYISGLLIGCIIVWAINSIREKDMKGDMTKQSNKTMHEILMKPLEFSSKVKCKIECSQFDEDAIKILIQTAVINFDSSHVGKDPCPIYMITGTTNGQRLNLRIEACRDQTIVMDILNTDQIKDCNC